MSAGNPRPDGAPIDAAFVRRLISMQFPRWADLPVNAVEVGGWDNRTFGLGARMTVRLPSAAQYAPQVEKEHRWLPKLAPLLPLPIPVPLAKGAPSEGYPYPWSVYRWLEGETPTSERIAALDGRVDTGAALEAWEAALGAEWGGRPAWFNGDVAFGNLLVENGRLGAVTRLRVRGRGRSGVRPGDSVAPL